MPKSTSTKDLSEGFDPRSLVEATKVQAPEFPWLIQALESCGPGQWESRAYVRYVSNQNPNQPGALWQFERNVVLNHQSLGMVVLDILRGNRLGGIEFVDKTDG
jgi:hypothetical protein